MSTHQTALFPYGGTPSCFGITSNGGSSLLSDQALLPPADEIRLAGCGQMRRKTADRAVVGIRDADKLPVNLSGSLLPGKILHDGCDTDAVGVLDLELPLLEPVLPSCHRCDVKVVLCKEKGEKTPVMRTVCPRPSVLSASSLRFFSTAAAPILRFCCPWQTSFLIVPSYTAGSPPDHRERTSIRMRCRACDATAQSRCRGAGAPLRGPACPRYRPVRSPSRPSPAWRSLRR